jgi:hypothetical protein
MVILKNAQKCEWSLQKYPNNNLKDQIKTKKFIKNGLTLSLHPQNPQITLKTIPKLILINP